MSDKYIWRCPLPECYDHEPHRHSRSDLLDRIDSARCRVDSLVDDNTDIRKERDDLKARVDELELAIVDKCDVLRAIVKERDMTISRCDEAGALLTKQIADCRALENELYAEIEHLKITRKDETRRADKAVSDVLVLRDVIEKWAIQKSWNPYHIRWRRYCPNCGADDMNDDGSTRIIHHRDDGTVRCALGAVLDSTDREYQYTNRICICGQQKGFRHVWGAPGCSKPDGDICI